MSVEQDSNQCEQIEDQDGQMFQMCEEFCQKLRRSNPTLYKQFCNIVGPGYQNPKDKLGELLSEEPELLRDLNNLLEDEVRYKSVRERLSEFISSEPHKGKAMDSVIKWVQSGQLDGISNKELILELFQGEPTLQQYFLASIRKKSDQQPAKKKVEDINRNYYQKLLDKNGTTFQDMKNELMFWDKFRGRVIQQYPSDYQQFLDEFLKTINLYSECIITQMELMEMINQCEWLEREYIDDIRGMLTTRVVGRRIQTQLFKPLKDTDFTQAERLTRSYVCMPAGYAKAVHNNILNHNWVSVPFGSEDQSFLIMRKNTFEEQLFKSEDERYEFDVNILQIKRTIKLVQQVMDSDEVSNELVTRIVDMRIIQQLYRNQSQDQNEIIQVFQARPQECAKIIMKRLKQKLLELTTARNTKAKAVWENVSLNNFHRSLDHRSFYFKKNDKLIVCGLRFIRELEELAKNAAIRYLGAKECVFVKRKPEPITFNLEPTYFNSLGQLTNIRPVVPMMNPLPEITDENVRRLPQMFVWFGNEQILQECCQFIIHYLQIMGGNSLVERKQGTQILIKLVNIMHRIPISPLQINELTLHEGHLKNDLIEMESYDVVYNPDEIALEVDPFIIGDADGEINLLPKSNTTLYVPQNLYMLVRFLHCLYQRMELAYTICKQNTKGQDSRYNLFKSTLFLSLKAKDFKYEDHLRSLFGKLGFLFSTLEKVLHDTAKQVMTCIGDPQCLFIMDQCDNKDEQFDRFFQTITGIANGEAIRIEDLKNNIQYEYTYASEDIMISQLYEAMFQQKAERKPIYRIANLQNTYYISVLPGYNSYVHEQGRIQRIPFLRRNLQYRRQTRRQHNQIEWQLDELCHLRPIGKQQEEYLYCI